MKSLLCVKPSRRLCATEALNHPWIVEACLIEETQAPPPGSAPLQKQASLRNVADNYRKNFAEDRKLKKGGSRFNLIDVLPRETENSREAERSDTKSADDHEQRGLNKSEITIEE